MKPWREYVQEPTAITALIVSDLKLAELQKKPCVQAKTRMRKKENVALFYCGK